MMDRMAYFVQEEVLDSIFFALPIWQHEASIGEICWAFESHGVISRGMELYAARNSGHLWGVSGGDSDALIVKNRISGSCVFANDNMSVVAAVSERMATDRPHETVIRVIRVTANESWEDEIRSIATDQDVPDNVYTLWIREEVPMCGRFNPPRQGEPQTFMAEKLLDRERLDYTEMLLRGLGFSPANILRPTSSADEITRESPRGGERLTNTEDASAELDLLECASCGLLKPKDSFSRNQRKTKGAFARCKVCIQGIL